MTLGAVWQSYLTLQKGEAVSELHFALPRMRAKASTGAGAGPACRVVVINSGRLADISMLARAVAEKDALLGKRRDPAALLFVDVSLSGASTEHPGLRRKTIALAVKYPFAFLSGLFGTGSFGCAVIALYRRWIRDQNIEAIELFSSNSRFIECLRIAAILEGCAVTEFLHGICSDVFGQFYEILDGLARQTGATLRYVNMLPTLPQPPAVDRHLIRRDGVEVYFVNEKTWVPRNAECEHDVLIVGGDIADGDYLETRYFQAEMAAARECRAAGYDVVYCAHPAQRERVVPYLPEGVDSGAVAEHANSSSVMIGHYSTVLFNAKITGHEVLIFEEAWPQIPANLAALFADRVASTYSLARVEAALAAVAGKNGVTVPPNGINLIQERVF